MFVAGEIWARTPGLLYVQDTPYPGVKWLGASPSILILMRFNRVETMDLAVRSSKDDRYIRRVIWAVLLR